MYGTAEWAEAASNCVCGCATPCLIRDTDPMENGCIFIMHPLGFLQIFYSGKQPGSQAAAGLDAHFLHFILARHHIAAHFLSHWVDNSSSLSFTKSRLNVLESFSALLEETT